MIATVYQTWAGANSGTSLGSFGTVWHGISRQKHLQVTPVFTINHYHGEQVGLAALRATRLWLDITWDKSGRGPSQNRMKACRML